MEPRTCEKCEKALPIDARFCPHCGMPLALVSELDAPLAERLARALGTDFTVLGELGRGGFAVVFSVRDQRLNRYLALKVMRPELFTSSVARERFHREAQFVAQLDHPHVLPVVFAGEQGGISYFAMPRVKGETLERRLERERPMALEDSVRIFRELALGLAYAHGKHVVHRDVKPANVLLDTVGKALLVDFGIAKGLSRDGGTLSFTGAVIGTPEYMSPEQASGSRSLDHRSDIYSLGVVAFEMLTGAQPFTAASPHELAHRKSRAVAPNVRHFRSEIPATLAEVVARALECDPDRRWQTASDIADRLA